MKESVIIGGIKYIIVLPDFSDYKPDLTVLCTKCTKKSIKIGLQT